MRVTNRRRWLRARIQLAVGLAATFVGWVATTGYHLSNVAVFATFMCALGGLADSILRDLN